MQVCGRSLDWRWGPLEVLGRWPRDRRVALLHSGRLDARWARWSVFAQPVGTYRFVSAGDQPGAAGNASGAPRGQSRWLAADRTCPVEQFTHKPFDDLRALLNATEGRGLWIGYLSYDLGRWVERLPSGPGTAKADRGWPIVELGYCPGYLVYDGLEQRWFACGAWEDQTRQLEARLRKPAPAINSIEASNIQSGFTREQFEQAVREVKRYIASGDVFQVNLAQRLTARFAGAGPTPTRALFDRLAAASTAWYGAYLELASGLGVGGLSADDTQRPAVLSASPELFLQMDAGRVVTRPIKGTRPASVNPAELYRSEKDTAELAMIVDLMRNDLGRVCDYGSVRVSEPRVIESHPTVHHGVATIEGRLHRSKDIVSLLRAALPGGSVTGAPKVRVMQIIDRLEPARRGPYCGCIGYLSKDQACLNVAIRTMQVDPAAGRVDFSVGSGVVADSDPADEYGESLDKAATMLTALGLERSSLEAVGQSPPPPVVAAVTQPAIG